VKLMSEKEYQISFMRFRPKKFIARVSDYYDVKYETEWYFHERDSGTNIALCCDDPIMGQMLSDSDSYDGSLFYFLCCESCNSIHWWSTVESLNNALSIDNSEKGEKL
jgi:hypothetical protein